MTYVIGPACIDVMDRSCVDECPVDCIYEGERKLYINPAECIDCGACKSVCPEEAIDLDRLLTGDQRAFVADNARFFSEPLPGRDAAVGAPGGAGDFGRIGVDTDLVAGY
ncbi:ferredoxin [Streptomyces sp. NPDC005799]|uniref:ferredoxin n=1 Tax=Streptomyces sp. NPDC005799 TaxID=3154678 RepID=UPI0033F0C72C